MELDPRQPNKHWKRKTQACQYPVQHYPPRPGRGSSLDVHQRMNGYRCGTIIHRRQYYLVIKNNETMPLAATYMDRATTLLSEPRQRKTNGCITHLWNLMFKITQMNLFPRQKQTHRSRNQTYGCQRENVGGRGKLESSGFTHTHTYETDKDLLCSTENPTQYCVTTYIGKVSEKERLSMHVYVYIYK